MMLETEIAGAIVELWKADRAVNCEVPALLDGRSLVIDIVGVARGHIAACSTKRSLTAESIEYVKELRVHANETWMGVAQPKSLGSVHLDRRKELRELEIGLYYVNEKLAVTTVILPGQMAARTTLIVDSLASMQQDTAGGQQSPRKVWGDRWESARRLLRVRPGLTVKELTTDLNWTPKDRKEWTRDAPAGRIMGIRGSRDSPARYYIDA